MGDIVFRLIIVSEIGNIRDGVCKFKLTLATRNYVEFLVANGVVFASNKWLEALAFTNRTIGVIIHNKIVPRETLTA